ncbi:MAG TPA: type II toxin-antitoxin system VapC family toxin [Pyrinomonadaceae bacterium]|jgi:predicted nucleic acid-binding protein|nr:type II toxin-antitoxin system VapC family toxin [Pyrinomonadaceae bacterium]
MSENYYADSSALVKRHVAELGSSWVQSEFAPASLNKIITGKLSVVEVLSAFNRRQRDKTLTATDYAQISTEFLKAVESEYQILDMTDTVLLEAQRLLETYPLRAGDAVQLASATLANAGLQSANLPALVFLGSDARLLTAANGEGLLTDDPQNH